MGDPMVGDPHFCPMICSQRKGQVDGFSGGGGYLNFVPEKGLGQFDRLDKGNIVALNGKSFGDDGGGFNIQIACGSSIGACLSFSGQADFFPLGQPLGNFDLNGLGCSPLADGNGFFCAVDEFVNGQRKIIFKVLAPNRGLPAASAAAATLGKRISSPGASLARS
jgi:hypothetical protein